MNQKVTKLTLEELQEKADKKESILIEHEPNEIIVVTDAGQRHPDIVEINLKKKGQVEIKLSGKGNILFEITNTKSKLN
ncbi:MAG: hypothetical protein KDE48_14065 [Anaerolineales bacterium]|nr:hypothetical protein [Anaerolineales bacterium]